MEHLEPPETQRKEGSYLEGAWACPLISHLWPL